MKKLLCTLVTILFFTVAVNANNISISGVSLNGQNITSHFSQINFSVSWDHSWRTSNNESNYDGAWIFIKFRKTNSSLWQHATINYNAGGAAAAGHLQPTGSILQTAADGKGAWIYRNAAGTGNVNFSGASLRWNYGADGVLDNDSVEIRVYALEMVYCTSGSFYLGSGGAETGNFKNGSTSNPYLVTSEAAITVGTTAGNLNYNATSFAGDQGGPIPLAFPKGYNAFWIMKYESSQQQYVDFLNALDAFKANARFISDFVTGTANNYVAGFPERAAGFMNVFDNLAFLDWSALRPLTELEYEKACRGYNNLPIANEYAWGNTTITATTAVNNANLSNETQQNGNACYGNTMGRPLRVGIYANDTTTTRTQTGGSYYGATELSGNVWEQTVTVGNASGRTYTGVHGDGYLDANGEANTANWPAAMMGVRGGGYQTAEINSRLSDRGDAIYNTGATRLAEWGCRGVRTAE